MKQAVIALLPKFLHKYSARIEASPIGYRLVRGAFWSFFGTFFSRGITLLYTIILARCLGAQGFGELGIIQSTIGMFGTFAGYGMGLTATKHVAELRNKAPERTKNIIVLSLLVALFAGTIMTLLLIGFAPLLAVKILAAPHIVGILRVSALLVLLGTLHGTQIGVLSGFESFRAISKINLIAGIVSFICIISGVYLGGLLGSVWGLIISTAINCLINHLVLRIEAKRAGIELGCSGCMREWPVLWHYSFPALLASITAGPITWLCNAIIVNQPNGYVQMGFYNAANQWFNALLFLPILVGQVVLPILSENLYEPNNNNARKVLILTIKLNALLILPVVLICSLLSVYIMGLYGQNFVQAYPTFIVVLLTAGLVSIQTPVGQVISASGRMWLGFAMNFAWGIAFLVFAWFLVDIGALGLATARLGAYILHSIWIFLFAYRFVSKK